MKIPTIYFKLYDMTFYYKTISYENKDIYLKLPRTLYWDLYVYINTGLYIDLAININNRLHEKIGN